MLVFNVSTVQQDLVVLGNNQELIWIIIVSYDSVKN
jgi:hypothetical protein